VAGKKVANFNSITSYSPLSPGSAAPFPDDSGAAGLSVEEQPANENIKNNARIKLKTIFLPLFI
jgi:hypothetical protein